MTDTTPLTSDIEPVSSTATVTMADLTVATPLSSLPPPSTPPPSSSSSTPSLAEAVPRVNRLPLSDDEKASVKAKLLAVPATLGLFVDDDASLARSLRAVIAADSSAAAAAASSPSSSSSSPSSPSSVGTASPATAGPLAERIDRLEKEVAELQPESVDMLLLRTQLDLMD